MQCPRCQHDSAADAAFCDECGARLGAVCSGCGESNRPGAKFCRKCGNALAGPAPSTPSRFDAPEAYTPKHLAEKILTFRGALEGERKQVTVLFADLTGSMELLVDRDPEEARELLDPVLERMMEAVHRYEGTVNQVMGDGIMALFGAPLAHEDHAVRACYAALAMQAAIRRYTLEVRRSHGVEVQIRVGLNSGEVVVRSIGSDLRMDYSAIGYTTHLAARMEQLAVPGSIRLTGETLRLAEGFVQVTSLGPIPVKGLPDRVEIFELIGAAPTRTRMQAVAARGLTRFVGRRTELEALSQALRRAGAGHGEVVALVGEPGVGKSRLVWEFGHSHRTSGWLVLESGSVSHGKATAYRPVIDLLKSYFQIEEGDDGRKICEKLIGKLLTLDRALEHALPALLSLLDVPSEDAEWHALDPLQRRQRTLDTCKRLILRESQVHPLLLIFEDLQWIDTETQAFLDGLVESLPTARVLLVVNYRPEYQQSWAGKTYYAQVRVDPLPPESAAKLLEALLGDDHSLRPFKELLIERSEGNPLFLEESVRTLVETHKLLGERGAYRLAAPLASIQVPRTVQALLAARIDRLPTEEKHLLQTAAVIGKDVPLALLEVIANIPPQALRQRLTHLQAAEFLYQTSLFPDLEYTFKHALTHDVAYASLLHERRRAMHSHIVSAIEELYADRLIEHVERLGQHALRGEVWGKAIDYCRQAGAKAFARSANREAVAWFDEALAALLHLPESRVTAEQAIDLRFDLRNTLMPLGEYGRILELLGEAGRLADTLNDTDRRGWSAAYMSVQLSAQMGAPSQAVEFAERALAIAGAAGDRTLEVATTFYLGVAHYFGGDYLRATRHLMRNIASLKSVPIRERFGLAGSAVVFSQGFAVGSLAELGDFEKGITLGEEAVRMAEEIGQPYLRAWTYYFTGILYLRRGNFRRATSLLERGLAISPMFTFPVIACGLGYAYVISERLAEGLPLLEDAVEQADSMKLLTHHSLRLATLGEARLWKGSLDEAVELAERAHELSRDHNERGCEAWVLRFLGEIACHRDPPDVEHGEVHYRDALALANSLGMRPLGAHCHLHLGKLYRRTGKREQAREHLTTAATMFREINMRFWLEQAEAEMAALG